VHVLVKTNRYIKMHGETIKIIIIIVSTSKPQEGEKGRLRMLETAVLQSIEGIALGFK